MYYDEVNIIGTLESFGSTTAIDDGLVDQCRVIHVLVFSCCEELEEALVRARLPRQPVVLQRPRRREAGRCGIGLFPMALITPTAGVLDMTSCTSIICAKRCACTWPADASTELCFGLVFAKRTFHLIAASGEEMEAWMLALKRSARLTCAVPSGAPITPGTDDSISSKRPGTDGSPTGAAQAPVPARPVTLLSEMLSINPIPDPRLCFLQAPAPPAPSFKLEDDDADGEGKAGGSDTSDSD